MSGLNLARLHEYPLVSIDTETTGLYWYKDKMFGVAIAALDGDKIVSNYYDVRTKPRTLEALRIEVPQIKRLVNHNVKFDVNFL
jgi:DNA polymerase III epsilon subunit-like protein